jgi:hypothetical protein
MLTEDFTERDHLDALLRVVGALALRITGQIPHVRFRNARGERVWVYLHPEGDVVWAEPGAEVSYPADSEQRNAPSHTS